jgi:hypothetical protein
MLHGKGTSQYPVPTPVGTSQQSRHLRRPPTRARIPPIPTTPLPTRTLPLDPAQTQTQIRLVHALRMTAPHLFLVIYRHLHLKESRLRQRM